LGSSLARLRQKDRRIRGGSQGMCVSSLKITRAGGRTQLSTLQRLDKFRSHPKWIRWRERRGELKSPNLASSRNICTQKVRFGCVPISMASGSGRFKDFAKMAKRAAKQLYANFVRPLRKPGDLEWRAKAAEVFKQKRTRGHSSSCRSSNPVIGY